MSKPFRDLRKNMSPEAQREAAQKTQLLLKEMSLQEVRQARKISQESLAKTLETKQANISRLERRTDIHISTLRHYVEAMGGELNIIARFPEGDVIIRQSSHGSQNIS